MSATLRRVVEPIPCLGCGANVLTPCYTPRCLVCETRRITVVVHRRRQWHLDVGETARAVSYLLLVMFCVAWYVGVAL